MIVPLKILFLEDDPNDAEIVQRLLLKANPDYRICHVTGKKDFLFQLDAFHPDIVLSDNNLPKFSGGEALTLLREHSPYIPFILVTGTLSDELAVKMIQSGADDYILKDRLTRLPAAIHNAINNRRLAKERQEATQKLVQSEAKYRTLFLKSPLPKWIYDAETLRFLEVNEAAIAHYGYSAEEFLNMTLKDIRPSEDVELLYQDLRSIQDGSESRKSNWRHLKKNGEIIFVESTAHAIDYIGKEARIVINNDVTSWVMSEKQKAFDQSNLSALINNITDPIWSVDKNLHLITCNDAFKKLTTSPTGEALKTGEPILSLTFAEEKRVKYEAWYLRALSGDSFMMSDTREDPQPMWFELSFFPINQSGEVVGVACFARNITERKKSEAVLAAMQSEMLDNRVQAQKKLTRAMIKAQERERNHIGRELHDNVNQILASAKLFLGMEATDNAELPQSVSNASRLIGDAIKEIRALTSSYVAPVQDARLNQLIQHLLDNLQIVSPIQTRLHYHADNAPINPELEINIYRIIQEQLNNIIKHADAKSVEVTIASDGKVITLETTDNGKGFESGGKRKGIGIQNMYTRVESFNGEMKIETAPGKGCKTVIRIPLASDRELY